jgi:hypothetical protein
MEYSLIGNSDINNLIIEQLNLDDLHQICSLNQYLHNLCIHNNNIIDKLNNVKSKVNDVLLIDDQNGFPLLYLYLTMPITLANFKQYLTNYNILIPEKTYKLYGNYNIEHMGMLMSGNSYYIQFLLINKKKRHHLNSSIVKNHVLKNFLFHMIYDNICYVDE